LAIQEYVTKLYEIYSLIKVEMAFAQAKEQEDVDRECNPAPVYQVRDAVWLNI
jgi:hypothetical protein